MKKEEFKQRWEKDDTGDEIPAKMLDAAMEAVLKTGYVQFGRQRLQQDNSKDIAKAALEAAGVPALLEKLNKYEAEIVEMIELLAAKTDAYHADMIASNAKNKVILSRFAELELFHRRLAIFAADLHDIASNGHLDDDLLAMRGVAALTAEVFSTEADKIEAYSWLDQAADALKEAE